MNIEQIKQIAKDSGATVQRKDTSVRVAYRFNSEAELNAFAQAVIKAYVAEQKPVAWMYDNNYLLKAELTAPVYEIKKPLYDLKGE